ncbi:MAG: MFS transporter [Clostridia bacterium]|nr:MFS transporter [Clostridia bacterium]
MRVLDRKRATMLILLCCLTYSLAYLGRLCYAANLANIIDDFGITKSEGGIVSSFFFFSYAAGQLLNAFLSRYYNPKYVVACSMAISGLCNLGIGLLDSVVAMRFVWLINGIVQSTLWCSILNIQSKYLSQSDISRAIIWNCVTYSIGTMLSYGLSALFTALDITWRMVFYVASVLLVGVAVLWYVGIRYTEVAFHSFGAIEVDEPMPAASPAQGAKPVKLFTKPFVVVFVFACVCAASCAFIRDGVVTWLPKMLIDDFGVSDSLSIILTMLLPEVSFFGAMLVKRMNRVVRGHLRLQSLFFVVAAVMLAVIISLYSLKLTVVTIACFTMMYLMICCVVNLTTSVIPFSVRQYGNVGSISAFLDACCYLGSVIATYVLGLIAETWGWLMVIYVAAGVAVVAIVVSFIGSLFAKRTEMTRNIF